MWLFLQHREHPYKCLCNGKVTFEYLQYFSQLSDTLFEIIIIIIIITPPIGMTGLYNRAIYRFP
jgi:hypothetical protein